MSSISVDILTPAFNFPSTYQRRFSMESVEWIYQQNLYFYSQMQKASESLLCLQDRVAKDQETIHALRKELIEKNILPAVSAYAKSLKANGIPSGSVNVDTLQLLTSDSSYSLTNKSCICNVVNAYVYSPHK
eukprot:gene1202-1386_t